MLQIIKSLLCAGAVVIIGMSNCHAASAQIATPGELVVSRYTTMPAAPQSEETDPLSAIALITFPRGPVKTVGEAIGYLLLRTGYALDAQQDQTVTTVFSRPLPESQRQLGPYSVDALLRILMGKAFELHADPLHRIVSYSPVSTVQSEKTETVRSPE
jgi:conjugative transfer region protein (TIGR03748 family)